MPSNGGDESKSTTVTIGLPVLPVGLVILLLSPEPTKNFYLLLLSRILDQTDTDFLIFGVSVVSSFSSKDYENVTKTKLSLSLTLSIVSGVLWIFLDPLEASAANARIDFWRASASIFLKFLRFMSVVVQGLTFFACLLKYKLVSTADTLP